MRRRTAGTARVASAAAVALGIAVVVVLFGVESPGRLTDVAAPLSAEDRDRQRTAFIDALWAPVADEYPEAIRPEIEFGRVVDDRSGRTARITCLRESGIRTGVDRGRVVYQSGGGKSQVELAVANYSCSARHPNTRDATAQLDARQLGALWDYYTNVTRPCLAAVGYATWLPPSRQAFAKDGGDRTWNPYSALRGEPPSEEQLEVIEAQCRSVPAWLDFRLAQTR